MALYQALEDVERGLDAVARVAGAALGLDAEMAAKGAAAAGADPERARPLLGPAVARPVDVIRIRLIEDSALEDLHRLGPRRPLLAQAAQGMFAVAAHEKVAARAIEIVGQR